MKTVLDNIFLGPIVAPIPLTEGRLPETAEGGAGCGARGRGLSPRTREAPGPRPPPLGVAARSSLTEVAQMPHEKRGPENQKSPQRSAERRAGPRHGPV